MYTGNAALEFCFPRDGDVMVGEADGSVCAEGLRIRVLVSAEEDAKIAVCGIPAQKNREGLYEAEVVLRDVCNRLEAENTDTGEKKSVTVYVFNPAYRTYRFTVDDCIRSFRNLHAHRNVYASLFEDPYLGIFEQAHRLYGSKVQINVFYGTDDGSFDLSMMTDRYREEFSANADWLSFSFHAMREHPDKPYRNTDGETVRRDFRRMMSELRRVVGDAARADMTTLHWGALNVEGARALRAEGCRMLCGYFTLCRGEPYYADCYEPGEPIVAYYLDRERTAHLEQRCFWVDTQEGILFSRLHMVLNAGELTSDRVAPYLDGLLKRPQESGCIQMVIHEQHFYDDYVAYEPDYRERILTMAHWMQVHGYRPTNFSEIIEAYHPIKRA